MLNKITLSGLLFLASLLTGMAENPALSVIPKPVKMKTGTGSFLISDRTALLFDAGNELAMNTASYLQATFKWQAGPF